MIPSKKSNTKTPEHQLKRKRVQFSCVICKQRKVKCDRRRPHCSVCIARKTTDKCYYPSCTSKSSSVNVFHISKEIGYNNDISIDDKNTSSDSDIYLNEQNTKRLNSSNDDYLIIPKINQSHSITKTNDDKEINNINELYDTISNTNILKSQIITDNNSNNKVHNSNSALVSEIMIIKKQLQNLENSIEKSVSISKNNEISDKSQHIKERIINLLHYLKIDVNEKFDIYHDYKPMFYLVSRINGYGPLAWIALVMKDPFSQPVLENILYEKFNNLKVSEIFYNQYIASPDMIHNLNNIDADADDDDDGYIKRKNINYNKYINSTILPSKKKNMENLTYNELINVFPKKRVIWLLVDRFFKYVYPFAPYVDQNVFTKQIFKILNTDRNTDYNSEEKISFIDINNKLDLAYVGCILIMLKLSYKSLITINSGEEPNLILKTEEEIYLQNNPLSDRMIEIAKYIIDNFDFTNRCTFPVYQCVLFLRFYQKIDGEKLYSKGETYISTSVLVQMASSLGMNRDPSKFVKPLSFSLCGSLGRKIWHSLVSIDNYQYFQEGIPKSIVQSFCDTKLPEFDESLSNNNDLNIEKITIKLIHTRNEIEFSMNPIADAICNIDEPPTVVYIMNLLENFQDKLKKKFGLFCDLLEKPNDNTYYSRLDKVCEVLVFIEGISLVFTVILHLSLKFESMKLYTSSKFFSNKILTSMMRFINAIPDLALSSHKYFGSGFDFVIIPTLEKILCKSMVFITSNYIKYSVFKQKLLKSETLDMERLPLVEQILHTFLYDIFYDKHLRVLKALSPNFFFAWRILKVQLYIFYLLKDEILSYEKQTNVFTFVEFSTPDDLMKTIQLLDLNNYNSTQQQSCYFSAVYEQYNEYMCDEDPKTKQLFSSLNPELQQMKQQLYFDANAEGKYKIGYDDEECNDKLLGTAFSVDEDKFWMEMFENNKQNNQQNDIFRILDSIDFSQKGVNYKTDIIFPVPDMNEVTECISKETNLGSIENENDPNIPSNKFVDEAIFDHLF